MDLWGLQGHDQQGGKAGEVPIPRIEELFASLAGGKTFSKLDLFHAYLQIPLDEASSQYVTINTHKGLFVYLRLPFGVASAPSIFQRVMENLLQGIPRVCVYIDDILVTGATEEEHLANLAQVLQRLKTAGMRLKREKCTFLLTSVAYLGHIEGLHTSDSKVKVVVEAPVTTASSSSSNHQLAKGTEAAESLLESKTPAEVQPSANSL